MAAKQTGLALAAAACSILRCGVVLGDAVMSLLRPATAGCSEGLLKALALYMHHVCQQLTQAHCQKLPAEARWLNSIHFQQSTCWPMDCTAMHDPHLQRKIFVKPLPAMEHAIWFQMLLIPGPQGRPCPQHTW